MSDTWEIAGVGGKTFTKAVEYTGMNAAIRPQHLTALNSVTINARYVHRVHFEGAVGDCVDEYVLTTVMVVMASEG